MKTRYVIACIALSAAVARADILVRSSGVISDGTLVSQSATEVVWQTPGESASVKIPAAEVTRIVLADDHGARKAPATSSQPATAAAPRWTLPPEPAAPAILPPPKQPTYYVIPLHGEVGSTFLASALEKSLADAALRKPTVVILDINSPGGLVAEAGKIAKILHTYNKQLRIVAHIDQDLSAAAVVTLSAREIYVKSTSTIGAATAYRLDKNDMPANIAEKMQSAWRAVARNSAQEGGHDPLLADAMIDDSMELHLETKDGKPIVREGAGDKTICHKGKILTLTSREAIECGLAAGMADDLPELSAALKLANWTECKGLGTLWAEYLPKRTEAFEGEKRKLVESLKRHLEDAAANDPTAGSFRQFVVTTPGYSPLMPGPVYTPRPPIVRPPAIRTPMNPAMPRVPRPYIPQPYVPPVYTPQPTQTVSTVVAADTRRWKQRSLACVLALQQVEADLEDAVALCEAFGYQGSAEGARDLKNSLAETRAKIYDDRNKYGESAGPTPSASTSPARRTPPREALTLPEAEKLLGEDKESQSRAARWLAQEPVDAKARKRIVELLRPLADSTERLVRVAALEALAQWADKDLAPYFADLLEKPDKVEGIPPELHNWSPAMRALVRLDADRAEQLIRKRRDIFFWRVRVIDGLRKAAAGDGPEKETAARLAKLADSKD